MSYEELADKLLKKKILNDILESRGYWTTYKKDKRQYMSLLDILKLVEK